jgi:endonuclease G
LIVRQGYSLAHNNVDLIADWVAYRLTREETEGTEKRPGDSAFKSDPLLPRGRRAERKDYQGWKDVYDRGHQCPANDAKGRGKGVMNDSFFLSNMTPQTSRLNQFKWRLLEDRIHKLAEKLGEVWVITGPAFVDDNDDGVIEYFVIGTNQVAVPTHYFKIVVARSQTDADKLQCMAFLIPNEAIDEHEFEEFLVSVDEIEKLTGFDFLPKLEPAAEDLLEASIAATVWSVAP